MGDKVTFKVGSRRSQLALVQTNVVIEALEKIFPEKKFEIIEMSTTGDKILDKPLPKIGEKSLFTKELEEALLTNAVDFVVHSLKDLPTILPNGLTIGAVLEREDPRDALIVNSKFKSHSLKSLPETSVIGTSSLRRTAQLHRNYPELQVRNIRGNLNTRLRKLDEDDVFAGIILAAAGVKRMKWEERIQEYLDPSEFLYAVGQGAIAVECRSDDDSMLNILECLNHIPTILRVITERSFLKTLGGGCSAPVAVHTNFSDNILTITGSVWSLDGSKVIQKSVSNKCVHDYTEPRRKWRNVERKCYLGISTRNIEGKDLHTAEDLGKDLAESMIKCGALIIIDEARAANEKVDFFQIDKSANPNGNTLDNSGDNT